MILRDHYRLIDFRDQQGSSRFSSQNQTFFFLQSPTIFGKTHVGKAYVPGAFQGFIAEIVFLI